MKNSVEYEWVIEFSKFLYSFDQETYSTQSELDILLKVFLIPLWRWKIKSVMEGNLERIEFLAF